MTKPLFAIPPHQFIFNCGSIDKRFYMDLLQLEEAEYNLIDSPNGVCACSNAATSGICWRFTLSL